MSKNGGKRGTALPEDVRSVIVRKLQRQQREQAKLWTDMIQPIYSTVEDERLANIQARKMYRAFASVPMEAYREVAAKAVTITDQWPGMVWKTIESTLEKLGVVVSDGAALNAIVDEFSWAVGKRPFTLNYIDPKRFREFVCREANRYGGMREDMLTAFDRKLTIDSAAAKAGILNTARHARAGIGILIDEYLAAQRHAAQVDAPGNSGREARKLETQAMYKNWQKEYRTLKKKRPNMSDVWYANQIARMAIAQGRDSDTIRKRMKS